MKFVFFGREFFFALFVILVRNTAVDRANRSTLGLIMEADTFGAFFSNYVIEIIGNCRLGRIGIGTTAVQLWKRSFNSSSIGETPFRPAFINSVIGTFWFAGTTVDALFSNFYCHLIICLSVFFNIMYKVIKL